MKTSHAIIGVGVLGLAGYFYYKHTKGTPSILTTMTQKPGYTSMMKISPAYYNSTSTEGAATTTATFGTPGILTPWVMPAEQGDAMTVSAGYGASSDAYATTVANSWPTVSQTAVTSTAGDLAVVVKLAGTTTIYLNAQNGTSGALAQAMFTAIKTG